MSLIILVFFSSRRRHTIFSRDWSSDVCSSDLHSRAALALERQGQQLRRSLVPLEDAEHRARIDRDPLRLGAAIEDGGDGAVPAQPLGQLLAGALPALDRELLRRPDVALLQMNRVDTDSSS